MPEEEGGGGGGQIQMNRVTNMVAGLDAWEDGIRCMEGEKKAPRLRGAAERQKKVE